MVRVYHQLQKDKLEDVRLHGLKIGPKGDKRDKEINRTDEFLNQHMPQDLKQQGVDRKTNIFCYLTSGGKIIDITTGEKKTPSEIVEHSGQILLEITVDPRKCFVSDLDLYDQIKQLTQEDKADEARHLAEVYWKKLPHLVDYTAGFRRPEVMVAYDVPVSAIGKSY